jgi:hypothetical protein
MTSRSNPDWLAEIIAKEGDTKLIEAQERDSLLNAIGSAASPEALDPHRHAQLLKAALNPPGNSTQIDDDPLAPPSVDEVIAAAATRKNLDDDALVSLLRAAHAPSELAPDAACSILSSTLTSAAPLTRHNPRPSSAAFWGVLAVAAAAALWVAHPMQPRLDRLAPTEQSQLNLAQSRTTRSLFSDSFAHSSASERIDRIAQVRQRELRDNRYLMWGLP